MEEWILFINNNLFIEIKKNKNNVKCTIISCFLNYPYNNHHIPKTIKYHRLALKKNLTIKIK